MSNNIDTAPVKLTAKDFASGQDVRWCPGCGDYSILAQVQRVLPELGIPKEKIIWISGIGCSSRFPYYMGTYGFHSIHGRALPIATGVKVARPDLSVWVATGDGDAMSIGGNHFIHTCRKNVDLKVLMFNNRIYGLTKGQYSPTSEVGLVSKSTPFGSVDYPFNPLSLALGSGSTFVARSSDNDPKHMQEVIKKAAAHKGTAFVEILQNCVIFNDGAFDYINSKENKAEKMLFLKQGQPMVFGKDNLKGIKLDGFKPVVIDLNDGIHSINDCWIHDELDKDAARSFILAHMTDHPELPMPFGVIRQELKLTYDEGVKNQIEAITEKKGKGSLQKILLGGNTWEVS
jgi:2-oxoglutarate ferredoxin oxidoreductase subunit beta